MNKKEMIDFIFKNKYIFDFSKKDLKECNIKKLEGLVEIIKELIEKDKTRYIS